MHLPPLVVASVGILVAFVAVVVSILVVCVAIVGVNSSATERMSCIMDIYVIIGF